MKTAIGVILIILAVTVILYLLMIMPRMLGRPDRKPFMGVLYAHRGLHDNESDAPENSMTAFRKAVVAGYGIELDVQLSKDKIPVIFHDFTLQRICGAEGRVADYTFQELQQFSLCKSSEKIPALAEFLKMVDGRVPLIVEYKIPGICTEVCAIADKLLQEYSGSYCVESFHPLGLFWYRKNRREIMRGQLSDDFVKYGAKEYSRVLYFILHHLLLNFLTKPDFIAYNHHAYKDLSRRLCRRIYGTLSVAWTIQSKEELCKSMKEFDLFIFDSFSP